MATPMQVTAATVALAMQEELRALAQLERAESLARSDGDSGDATPQRAGTSPDGELQMGAEAADGKSGRAWPIHGRRKPRRVKQRRSGPKRLRARDSFSVSTALSQSVQSNASPSPHGRFVHTTPRGEHGAAFGFAGFDSHAHDRRGSAPGPTTPLSRISGSCSTLGGASVTSAPVIVPATATRGVVDYVPLGCLTTGEDPAPTTPRRSVIVSRSSHYGYSTGGSDAGVSYASGATDATTIIGSDEDMRTVGLPLVIEVITCDARSEGGSRASGSRAPSHQSGISGYHSSSSVDEQQYGGSAGGDDGDACMVSVVEHRAAAGATTTPAVVAWLASSRSSADGGTAVTALSPTSIHSGSASVRGPPLPLPRGQSATARRAATSTTEDGGASAGAGEGAGAGEARRDRAPAAQQADSASCSPLADDSDCKLPDTDMYGVDLEAGAAAAAPCTPLEVARRQMRLPPVVAILSTTAGRTLSIDSHDSVLSPSSAAQAPATAGNRFGFTMPRVSVELWDDVVDEHVPRALAPDSSQDSDSEPPLSPVAEHGKEAAPWPRRCWTCTARVARRIKSATAPGTKPSRAVYEQLKWGPILVGMLPVLVPLSLDGETLNRFTFSLLFQALYFLVSIAFAFSVYGLLYPLPPTKHLATFTVCTTSLYVTLMTLAMSFLSGVALTFVLPAILVFMSNFTIAFLVNAAVSTCIVPVTPGKRSRTPSTWDVITGRVPVHTRKRPVVGPNGSLPSILSPKAQPNQFVLNAEALLPLRQLFIGFGVVAVSYYWFQVYTRSLSFNLNAVLFDAGIGDRGFGVATVLVFEFALFCLRRLMRIVVDRRMLVRVGIPETSARATSSICCYAVVLGGAAFERLLFLNFNSVSALGLAVAERTALHVGVDLVTQSRWYYALRSKVVLAAFKRCGRTKDGEEPYMRDYDEYLYDQHVINMFAHVANFTSLATWGLALAWFRFGYNAPVFPFAGRDRSDEEFLRLLSYGLVLAMAEFGELLLVRILAMHGRRARVRYFNKALRPMQHWAARAAFVLSAAHMLQDAVVALVQLEPNSA